MNILKALTAIPLLALLSLPALAHPKHVDNGIHDRLQRQEQRIEQGLRSGELTHREQHRLQRELRETRQLLRDLRRDGNLNRGDRHALQRKLDANSRLIARLKHNSRQAPITHRRFDDGRFVDHGYGPDRRHARGRGF